MLTSGKDYYFNALEGAFSIVTIDSIHKIWFHYERLGLLSPFQGFMFPLLFKNSEYKNLRCDSFEFAKYKRIIFLISNEKKFNFIFIN